MVLYTVARFKARVITLLCPLYTAIKAPCRDKPVVTGAVSAGRKLNLHPVLQVEPRSCTHGERIFRVPTTHRRLGVKVIYSRRGIVGPLAHRELVSLHRGNFDQHTRLAAQRARLVAQLGPLIASEP